MGEKRYFRFIKIKIMEFIKKLEVEFKAQTDAIRVSYEKIIYAHFEDLKITDRLDKYNWQENINQLLEWSCGDASENDCKKEILRTYTEYLSKEDKEYFNQNWILDFGKEYLENKIF